MFGMSMTEMMIILVVALIFLGPNDLPKAAKTIGKTIKDLQKAGDDLRETFQREIMEEPTKPKAPPEGAVAVNAPKAPPAPDTKPALVASNPEPTASAENTPAAVNADVPGVPAPEANGEAPPPEAS